MSQQFLLKALEQAELGRGFCAPNPAVGAVLVKDNKIIAVGYHHGYGQAHAEVDALTKLSHIPKDATLYVTLEPCCHWGKTPPCTDKIIESGIQHVIYGFADPNPIVAGQGAANLIAAGIDCKHNPIAEINDFYQSYTYWQKNQTPFVSLKLAISFDGKIALSNNRPISITGSELATFTHQQRKRSDAILTTSKTILADNPQLNARLNDETIEKPLYIIDSNANLPIDARVFSTAKNITLFYNESLDKSRLKHLQQYANCISLPSTSAGLNLQKLLVEIGKDGIHDLWVEAGGRCAQSFLANGLVQRFLLYVGTKWLGSAALSAFDDDFNGFSKVKSKRWFPMGDDVACEMLFSEHNCPFN